MGIMRMIPDMRPLAIALIVGVPFLAAGANATVVQWEESVGGNGHWYEVVLFEPDAPSGWERAKMQAYARGGYLATITSADENAFVVNLISNPAYWTHMADGYRDWQYWNGPLIGGYQASTAKEPSEGWRWITGEAMDYQNWHPHQPDNLGNQNRLHYWGNGKREFGSFEPKWDDVGEFGPNLSYVVEYDTEVRIEVFPKSRRMFRRKRVPLRGVASARSGVAGVEFHTSHGQKVWARGGSRWRFTVDLRRGRNRLTAVAVSRDGDRSAPVRMVFHYLPR